MRTINCKFNRNITKISNFCCQIKIKIVKHKLLQKVIIKLKLYRWNSITLSDLIVWHFKKKRLGHLVGRGLSSTLRRYVFTGKLKVFYRSTSIKKLIQSLKINTCLKKFVSLFSIEQKRIFQISTDVIFT